MKTYGVIYIIYHSGLHWEMYIFLINKLFIFILPVSDFSVPFLCNN